MPMPYQTFGPDQAARLAFADAAEKVLPKLKDALNECLTLLASDDRMSPAEFIHNCEVRDQTVALLATLASGATPPDSATGGGE